jgi:hypothetical protein
MAENIADLHAAHYKHHFLIRLWTSVTMASSERFSAATVTRKGRYDMLKSVARLGTAAGATLLATAFVLPASPAMASGRSCQVVGALDTCDSVNGSGLHVNYVQGSVQNTHGSVQTNIHIELSGPRGLIKNCAQTNIQGLATIYCKWSPNANEPAGQYCTTTWKYANGSYSEQGHACVDVHS